MIGPGLYVFLHPIGKIPSLHKYFLTGMRNWEACLKPPGKFVDTTKHMMIDGRCSSRRYRLTSSTWLPCSSARSHSPAHEMLARTCAIVGKIDSKMALQPTEIQHGNRVGVSTSTCMTESAPPCHNRSWVGSACGTVMLDEDYSG